MPLEPQNAVRGGRWEAFENGCEEEPFPFKSFCNMYRLAVSRVRNLSFVKRLALEEAVGNRIESFGEIQVDSVHHSSHINRAGYFVAGGDQGERNNGFDVLYHNMKHGHFSTKDLADFIRERATIEEAYSRSMTKLAKSASNYTQLGTFAPVWDVFKTSTEKLASCHLDLVRRLQELIKEVHKYGDEQIKAYKKTKDDVSGTLEAVQNIQSITQALQKSKENYNAKCVEQERLKKEGATQREVDKAAVKSKKATDT
ncbi:PREDICTED: FCH domain only protein 2, partial [Nipponia nippon]|uniref:FCH domain only protein 2 n=1 Tax=Nipponia nippon TaxID=128390 RepID=UPI000510FF12